MYRLLNSFLSGKQMLAEMMITQAMFDAMPRSRPSAGWGNRRYARSKYMPHQSKQECARRVRQMQKSSLT